jgi:hypothetical protein
VSQGTAAEERRALVDYEVRANPSNNRSAMVSFEPTSKRVVEAPGVEPSARRLGIL